MFILPYYITKDVINQGLHKKMKNVRITFRGIKMIDIRKAKIEFKNFVNNYDINNHKIRLHRTCRINRFAS